jgi:isoleucyl-tRNA synthetase
MSKSLGNTVEPQSVTNKLGGEIVRLWVASTDYSGDLNIDDKILARVVDAYRRIRNTLRFLLANVSDFDPALDTVPADQLLEIDRYALARAAQLQAEILRHFDVYEFHPVVSKLQVYCSEDLGAFYLDVLKDRLYTSAPNSRERRSAQTALWQITQAMLRWMAPFLSFTAEEAWAEFAGEKSQGSIFFETFWPFLYAERSAARQMGAAAPDPRRRQQGDRDGAHRRAGRLVLAGHAAHHGRRRRRGPAAIAGRRPEVRDHHLRRPGGRRRHLVHRG